MKPTQAKKLKKEVLDHLNQVSILLEDVKYDYGYTYNQKTNEEETHPVSDDNNYLHAVKRVTRELIDGAERNELAYELEYYTSGGQ